VRYSASAAGLAKKSPNQLSSNIAHNTASTPPNAMLQYKEGGRRFMP
jgi:hypothetical protein